MNSSLAKSFRRQWLRTRNLRRVRRFAAELTTGAPPVFILTNPADLHFAPLAVSIRSQYHAQIFVGNGLTDSDAAWLQERCPEIPMLRLSASLSGNAASYLPHGELVDLLALSLDEPFFIQDADCFVLDPTFFEHLRIPDETEYATGPYWKDCPDWDHLLPDTFLVGINSSSLRRVRNDYQVDASIAVTPPNRAASKLAETGLQGAWFPEQTHDKHYFDTLQLSWILATLDGEHFGKIEGQSERVHHVGGTSYLAADPPMDLSHWDWWPLNTCYTTMRILDCPEWERLRKRFHHLYERFGDTNRIVSEFSKYTQSQRFKTTNRIFSETRLTIPTS